MPIPTRRTRTASVLGGVLALALAAGGAITSAPQANAASETPTTASATWGFKQSFRTYLGAATGATIVNAEGASFTGTTLVGTPPKNTSAYNWPAATPTGSYDPVTHTGTIHLAGRITYAYPTHFINEVSLANLTVVLNGDGTGVLKADARHDVWGGASGNPADIDDLTQATIANLTNVPLLPTTTNTAGTQTDTFAAITTTLTDGGATALGLSDFYAGGTVIDPLTVNVAHASIGASASTTRVTVTPSTVAYGRARTAKVTVTGGVAVASGSVTLKDGGHSLGTRTLSSTGTATYALARTAGVGRHLLTASYGGSVSLLASSRTATLTVVKAATSSRASLVKKSVKVGKRGTLKAGVTASGFTPGGRVQVKEGSKVLTTVTLSRGKATITLPKLKKGSHKLVVRYLGSGTAKASTSSKVTLTVKKK